jgi:N-acetylglucosaminyl-diphospho-decaprenol L-rhamnosyltransferase
VDWDLVVVDNASQDDTVSLVHELAPRCTLVQTGRNAGYAAGINAGVRAIGRRDAYLIVNPDVRLRPGCIPTLLLELERPGVGIAVPQLENAHGELILSLRREPTLLRALGDLLLGAGRAGRFPLLGEMVSDSALYSRPQMTDWAEGSTQMVSDACWQACGAWDERFFLYSEETEFDLRARDAGWSTAYQPAARATHLEGGSAGSVTLWALLQVNRVRLYSQRNGPLAAAAFWAATVMREGSRSLMGRPQNRAALRALLTPTWFMEQPGPHSLLRGRGRSPSTTAAP